MTEQDRKTVYVNGRYLSQPLSGVQRYAEEILSSLDAALSEGDLDFDVVVLAPKKIRRIPKWRSISLRHVGLGRGHFWEQFQLPIYASNGMLISLVSSGPIFTKNQILTFHDAAIFDQPKLFSNQYRILHSLLRPILGRIALRVVTVSHFSRDRLADALGISPEKISVIGNGCDHILAHEPDDSILARKGLIRHQYGLCVGATPNKNIPAAAAAISAASIPHIKLAVAGAATTAVFGRDDHSRSNGHVALGFVTDGELRSLYENAAFFAFPSVYEGFGIPPLEAMALGCPVIANNTSAIPEVSGDAAIIVDASDPVEFANAIRASLDESSRRALVQRGYRCAARHTWKKSGSAWVQLIDECIGRHQAYSNGNQHDD